MILKRLKEIKSLASSGVQTHDLLFTERALFHWATTAALKLNTATDHSVFHPILNGRHDRRKKVTIEKKHDKEKTFCRLVSNEAIFAPQLTFSDKTASQLNHNGLFLYPLVVLFREKLELKTDWFNARGKKYLPQRPPCPR